MSELKKLSESEVELLEAVLGDPLKFEKPFVSYLEQYLTINPPLLPITQFKGFAFHGKEAYVAASESMGPGGFTDLTTVGPTLSDLPNGTYAILWGAVMENTGAGTAYPVMGISINGGSVEGGTGSVLHGRASSRRLQRNPTATGMVKTIETADEGNEIKAKYSNAGSGDTARFEKRWLVAIRIS